MAYINVNSKVMNNFNSEDLIAMLNSVIDAELAKDESQVNTALVNDCVDAIISIEQDKDDKFSALIPRMSADEFLKQILPHNNSWKNLNVFVRAGIVAAVVASTTLTANAAVESLTGVNVMQNIGNAVHDKFEDWGIISKQGIDQFEGEDDDDEDIETTAPSTTEPTTQETTVKTEESTTNSDVTKPAESTTNNNDTDKTTNSGGNEETKPTDSEKTTNSDKEKDPTKPNTTRKPVPPTTVNNVVDPNEEKEVYLLGIRAEFDNFKTDYIYGEELTYEGLKLTRVYSDDSEKELALELCDYTKSVNMNVTADYTLRIIYESCVVTVDITVRPDENTRGAQVCTSGDYDYLLTADGAYVTAYRGSDTTVNLNEIDGNKVIAICTGVFVNSDVEFVNAENIETIYPSAFKNCVNLKDCYTPRAVYVGDSAFENCSSLDEAVFSDNVNYLGTNAYRKTAIEKMVVPNGITQIPEGLCDECASLKYVVFEGDVTSIGVKAFNECKALAEITGTENIKEVLDYAFYECENVNFDEALVNLRKAGDGAFAYCKSLDFGPLKLKEVGMQSFIACTKLTSVELLYGITVVPFEAFRAAHIDTLVLPEGIKKIDNGAFMSINVTSIDLPRSLEEIGQYGLYITRLRTAKFNGKNVSKINESAFYKSSRLKFYVYDNTTPLAFAVDNKIAYEIIEDLNPDDRIDQLVGEDD